MPGKTHRIGPNLIDVSTTFATEEACAAYLEAARWPNGVRCPKCGHDKVSKFTTNETSRQRVNAKGERVTVRVPSRQLYQCLNKECKYQFSVTEGTIFNDTHLPLNKWFMATALMLSAKKGISAKQMERHLNISYKTAWYLCHRIRKAMEEGNPGLLTGVVECDETYIGGRYDDRRKRARRDKQAVFGAIQRNTPEACSKIRTFPIDTASKKVLTGAVKGNVSVKAEIVITDEARGYQSLGKTFQHETVNHISLEYVRKGDPRSIHTNSIEGFWSLFKRGLIGSFHQVSVKHLRRYLDEFSFRFNNRDDADLFALVVFNLVISAGVRYAELTAAASEPDEPEQYSGPRSSWEPW